MSNKPRTLEDVMNDMASAQKDADKDLDSLPIRLRPTHEIAAREARETLVKLREEYHSKLFANSLVFLLAGGTPERETQFAAVAEKEGSTFTFDADNLYTEFAKVIDPAIGNNREVTIEHLGMLNELLRRKRIELGITWYPTVSTQAALEAVPTFESLVSYIRRLVLESGASSLSLTHSTKKIVDQAIERKFTGRVCAVVAVNVGKNENEKQAVASWFSRSATVNLAGDVEINKAFAINAFKEATGKKAKEPAKKQESSKPETEQTEKQNENQTNA